MTGIRTSISTCTSPTVPITRQISRSGIIGTSWHGLLKIADWLDTAYPAECRSLAAGAAGHIPASAPVCCERGRHDGWQFRMDRSASRFSSGLQRCAAPSTRAPREPFTQALSSASTRHVRISAGIYGGARCRFRRPPGPSQERPCESRHQDPFPSRPGKSRSYASCNDYARGASGLKRIESKIAGGEIVRWLGEPVDTGDSAESVCLRRVVR